MTAFVPGKGVIKSALQLPVNGHGNILAVLNRLFRQNLFLFPVFVFYIDPASGGSPQPVLIQGFQAGSADPASGYIARVGMFLQVLCRHLLNISHQQTGFLPQGIDSVLILRNHDPGDFQQLLLQTLIVFSQPDFFQGHKGVLRDPGLLQGSLDIFRCDFQQSRQPLPVFLLIFSRHQSHGRYRSGACQKAAVPVIDAPPGSRGFFHAHRIGSRQVREDQAVIPLKPPAFLFPGETGIILKLNASRFRFHYRLVIHPGLILSLLREGNLHAGKPDSLIDLLVSLRKFFQGPEISALFIQQAVHALIVLLQDLIHICLKHLPGRSLIPFPLSEKQNGRCRNSRQNQKQNNKDNPLLFHPAPPTL